MPEDKQTSSHSIAWSLQHLGYQTIFATDDRRFNNLGEAFGFQKIIGPKVGANDIILGTFNDFPLSNLLVNLPFSRWLFPYNYMNRACYHTYYPQTFDWELKREIAKTKTTAPLFLAVHFTLPHWPYASASSSPAQFKNEYSLDEREQLYVSALRQVDQQVFKLLQVLQEHGFLENSLVVLLSDHGESFYVPGSRQTRAGLYQGVGHRFAKYLNRKTSTTLEMSAGHGSDLLSPDQFHCLLAFKIYQHHELTTLPKQVDTRVALIDIAPTIIDFLRLPYPDSLDGISLLKALTSTHSFLPERAFVMESGMLPNQFLSREKAKVLAKKYFTINPKNGHVELQKQEIAALDALKLYGVIQKNWIFALYPDDDGYIPVILNTASGEWSDDIHTEFTKKSEAQHMLNHLQQFYHHPWKLSKLTLQ